MRRGTGLAISAEGLPARLKSENSAYETAVFGKWHLADQSNGWLAHPASVGFDYYSVLPGNAPPSYFSWVENLNGVAEQRTGYTPERKVTDALDWIDRQEGSPWFLWFAFNLPHLPFFVPPGNSLEVPSQEEGLTADQLPNSRDVFDAMVKEMDRQIGTLLNGLAPEVRERTVIVFVGDNGTTREAIDSPYAPERPKFTLYQGGIHVPLIIAGPGIEAGKKETAMVNTTDLFATILDLATTGDEENSSISSTDSKSLLGYLTGNQEHPDRSYNYSDKFLPLVGIEFGDFAIRDSRYKLISSTVKQEFYDLSTDPAENDELLAAGLNMEQREAYDRLLRQAYELHSSIGASTPVPEA